ncbi:hypothetical protein ABZ826_37780 [Streptomyces sp. NPDC047515]|uniref:hypothetical protein n=1 Tax=Streptomyces sp. NPDC047515 TaxID=3155380 RepID=UPI003411C9D4
MSSPAAAAHLALHVLLRAPDMGPRADLAVLIDHGTAGAGTTAARPQPRLVADSLDVGPSVTGAEALARRRPHGGPAPSRASMPAPGWWPRSGRSARSTPQCSPDAILCLPPCCCLATTSRR